MKLTEQAIRDELLGRETHGIKKFPKFSNQELIDQLRETQETRERVARFMKNNYGSK